MLLSNQSFNFFPSVYGLSFHILCFPYLWVVYALPTPMMADSYQSASKGGPRNTIHLRTALEVYLLVPPNTPIYLLAPSNCSGYPFEVSPTRRLFPEDLRRHPSCHPSLHFKETHDPLPPAVGIGSEISPIGIGVVNR